MRKMDRLRKQARDEASKRAKKRIAYQNKEWYNIRALLGNQWAFFYILLGARERGKSYSVMEYCVKNWKRRKIPFVWIRLSEASTKKMLANNAAQFVDADLCRKYKLKLTAKGTTVFDRRKKMATVLALSTAHNDKGVALFDNEYDKPYNIVIDEFQLEKSQRRNFDISYNLVVSLENLVRSRKEHIHIFMIGNTTEEASDILSMFNFIPQNFGVYRLRSKRCVIDYMPNSEAYEKRRKGTVGDILAGNTSNFTNSIETDVSDVCKKKHRIHHPEYIIKFSKDTADWFTVWDGNVIAKWNKEKLPGHAMMRYIDDFFDPKFRDMIYTMYDARSLLFKNLLTKKQFAYKLSLIKRQ